MRRAQFMTGDALLVSPILHWNVAQAPAYFPPGRWYSLYDYAPIDAGTYGLNSTVYVRTTPYCSSASCFSNTGILPGASSYQAHVPLSLQGLDLGAASHKHGLRRCLHARCRAHKHLRLCHST